MHRFLPWICLGRFGINIICPEDSQYWPIVLSDVSIFYVTDVTVMSLCHCSINRDTTHPSPATVVHGDPNGLGELARDPGCWINL